MSSILSRVSSPLLTKLNFQKQAGLIEKEADSLKSAVPALHASASTPHAPTTLSADGQQQLSSLNGKPSAPRPVPELLRAYYTSIKKLGHDKALKFQGCPEEAQALWQEYMSGKKNWHDIVEEAHSREAAGRASLMRKWHVMPAEYQPKINEDVVIRTGTDPMAPVGRGEFSDEDLTANTLHAWQRLQDSAQKLNLRVLQDEQAGFFCIPELNTLVWKPKPPISPQDQPSYRSYINTISTHPEVVDPASAKPVFSMEYVLAMINKGQKGLCDPVEQWGKDSFQRYETLIQLAKSTHHAMEKTDLAQQYPQDHERLWNLCKMLKSPEELGIFKPRDSEEAILTSLRHEQSRMKKLMALSFSKASQDLDQQIEDFTQFLKAPRTEGLSAENRRGQSLYQDPADTYQRLCKIKMQLDVLNESRHHAPFLHPLFNDTDAPRRKSFQDFQNHLKQHIENMPIEPSPVPFSLIRGIQTL